MEDRIASRLLSDEAASDFLESQDKAYGKNQEDNIPTQPRQSLGQARSAQPQESSISSANDSFWKTIPLQNLPSGGLFYPDGAELSIRSADVSEIRQWSTIDEGDILDVDDQLNFIIEKCTRFKINGGQMWLTWRDILEVDRLFIVFMIHEITFPTGQNELYAKFTCNSSCTGEEKFEDTLLVNSGMLQIFSLPEELMQWYSQDYKCFEVVSTKLNDTWYLYMPTIGVIERLRKRIAEIRQTGKNVDKAFIKYAPYIIQDWSKFGKREYSDLQMSSFAWHINKFTFINEFVDQIQLARETSISTGCPKCGSILTTPLFSQSSFTIKNLFLISGRLNELI